MSKKKFIPMAGLDDLNEEQRQEYYINACDFFGIPAELNLLRFLWLDSGDGGKHLVLYALRGATDMLRDSRGICVDEMKETIGDGFIMFTAKGHNKDGRTDVAVGAADTKGRSGKYLTDALMTAQTRASRRLTLQFVGGGLLDESEVMNTTTNIVQATQPLAEIAAPAKLSPNAAPGRDITLEKVTPLKVGDAVQMPNGQVERVIEEGAPVIDPVITATGDRLAKAMIENVINAVDAAVAEVPAPKKRRRRKGEVVLESPGQEAPPTPTNGPTAAQEAAALALAGVNATKLAVAAEVVPEPSAPLPAAVEAPASIVRKDQPNDEQKKAFRDRLFTYTNTVLREGKMVPCEGIGGVENKIKAFVGTMFPQTKEVKYLTVNQWETFLGYLDEKHKELGGEGLVKLINEKIGAKE